MTTLDTPVIPDTFPAEWTKQQHSSDDEQRRVRVTHSPRTTGWIIKRTHADQYVSTLMPIDRCVRLLIAWKQGRLGTLEVHDESTGRVVVLLGSEIVRLEVIR